MQRIQFWPAFALLSAAGLVAFAEITLVPPESFKLPPPPLFTNSILLGTNELPRLESKRLDGFSSLPPGVYLTKPYTCMVKVPDAVPDDIFQMPPPVTNQPMQVLRPDLKTVPLGQPDK